ncbi:flagellar biosynthetic protein FliO [Oceanobacillus rekensis]|uniref:flagellar biosynthetic protein FliO n=1 Tax=Oceanobacillus rekensis TaxID=937927 RepID=UPI001FE7E205|nr:flagellar biosynthetic protein FliO [Oceanobacillus rekensis]
MGGEVDCGEPANPKNETEDNNNELLNRTESNGSLAFEIVKMFFALILVIALIYILIKFLSKRNKLFNHVKALDNLGGISVGQNKSIQIIRIGSQLYLVGVGENVELLQEITDEEVKRDILLSSERTTDNFPGGALLTSLIPNKKDAKPDPSENNFKALFSKELENLKQNRNKMINKHKEDPHE